MSDQDRVIRLQDGRCLAYTEHGDSSGKPLLFIHGNPGSRWMRHPDEGIAASLGARIITPDRPGYGLSDFQPNRRLLDYPDDIEQLMDGLGIDRFGVMGGSAGGPYAAACAYRLPKRVTRTAIVSSVAPFDRDGAGEGMPASLKFSIWVVKHLPIGVTEFILRQQVRQQTRDPEKSLNQRAEQLSVADQAALTRPEIRSQILGYRQEAARQGVRGMARELQILASPWGFRLEDISGEVHVWHWEGDAFVPIQMGRHLAAHIPNAKPHFLPDGGHYSIFDHWRDILRDLVAE